MTKWIKTWKKNGWINTKKLPVDNQDLIKKIDKILSFHTEIKFIHVDSHTGGADSLSVGNDVADKLAKSFMDNQKVKVIKKKDKIIITTGETEKKIYIDV